MTNIVLVIHGESQFQSLIQGSERPQDAAQRTVSHRTGVDPHPDALTLLGLYQSEQSTLWIFAHATHTDMIAARQYIQTHFEGGTSRHGGNISAFTKHA